MGIVKTNFSAAALAAKLEQRGERAVAGVLGVMREEANKMADLAREFAPIDHGDLESAIEVVENKDGMNGRKTITVQVDPNARDDQGKLVEIYAIEMHEGQSIGENDGSYAYGLGKRSREKDGGRGVVGGKFLERAVKSRVGILGKKVAAALKRSLK